MGGSLLTHAEEDDTKEETVASYVTRHEVDAQPWPQGTPGHAMTPHGTRHRRSSGRALWRAGRLRQPGRMSISVAAAAGSCATQVTAEMLQ